MICHSSQSLYDHLRDTLTTQGLAALELLALESSKRIEDGSYHQEDRSNDQARRLWPDADPLYCTHDKVDCGAHIIRAEFTDECVELGRCWADSQKQGDFDEYNDKGAHSVDRCQISAM